MLILALGGVLVGFAFLVVSLVTENSSWAWGCIVACVLAAGVLAVDTRRRRRPAAEGGAPVTASVVDAPTEVLAPVGVSAPAGPTDPVSSPGAPAGPAAPAVPGSDTADTAAPEPAGPAAAVADTAGPDAAAADTAAPDAAEPDVEDADAADILVVAGLEQEVLVVDEHPRFHVPSCTWLSGRPTLSLPAREAVELGFTPCSRCAPSRVLASLSRA